MIIDAISYLQTRLKSLGFKEHFDGFDNANIPRTELKDVFFLDPQPVIGVRNNQSDQEALFTIQVQVYLCPMRDNRSQRDKSYTVAQNIINDIIKAENRLTYSVNLKDVRFRGLDVKPLNQSNDNATLISIDFEALVIFTPEVQDC